MAALEAEEQALRTAQRSQRGQADLPTDVMYAECQELLQVNNRAPHILAVGHRRSSQPHPAAPVRSFSASRTSLPPRKQRRSARGWILQTWWTV